MGIDFQPQTLAAQGPFATKNDLSFKGPHNRLVDIYVKQFRECIHYMLPDQLVRGPACQVICPLFDSKGLF